MSIQDEINELLRMYDGMSSGMKDMLQYSLNEIGTGFSIRSLFAGDYLPYDMDDFVDTYEASTKKSKMKNRVKRRGIRKENVTEIEVNGEPYYIWESFNGFKGSKENPNQFITNARAILDFNRNNGFNSIQDVIDYINQYFSKSTKKSVQNPQSKSINDMVKDIRIKNIQRNKQR